jgi:hypothetical protein
MEGLNVIYSKQWIVCAALAILTSSCSSQTGTKSEGSSAGAISVGVLSINGGAQVTEDSILSLKVETKSKNISKIKVGFTADCSDGEWEKFSENRKISSRKLNRSVHVSAQLMDNDGNTSGCFGQDIIHDNPNTPSICETNPEVCDRSPQVSEPGVVTILLALGDQLNQQMIVSGTSAAVIAESAIRFASPMRDPKILVVRDKVNFHSESYQDTEYIARNLLRLYRIVDLIDEPLSGLKASDLAGYDLIWFNNPGYPMGSLVSRDVLINFAGGVVISGDDMTSGRGFSMQPLTGLGNIDNGTSVTCAGVSYHHDNNSSFQYRVNLNALAYPMFPTSAFNFRYGNDIDNSYVLSSRTEVIAWAQGGPSTCTEKRPVIARYQKNF